MFLIILASILFVLVLCEPHLIKMCESSVGHVVNASQTGGKFKDGKYILKRGTTAGIEIYFDTEKKIHEVKAFAKVTINGLEMSYPLPILDESKVFKCPLQKGGPCFYAVTLLVKKFLLTITFDAKLQLRNENEDVIVCIFISAKVE